MKPSRSFCHYSVALLIVLMMVMVIRLMVVYLPFGPNDDSFQ